MTVLKHGNAIIEISRPELTPEERARREQQILIAMNQIGKDMVAAESRRKQNAG